MLKWRPLKGQQTWPHPSGETFDTMIHQCNDAYATHHQQTKEITDNKSWDAPIRLPGSIAISKHEPRWFIKPQKN